MAGSFDFYTSRLYFADISPDPLANMTLMHHLSAFENHVYGVLRQYDRIREDLEPPRRDEPRPVPVMAAGLDIYYYTLTWDRLRKIQQRMNGIVNGLPTSPKDFKPGYREWRKRVEHLFREFGNDSSIRNRYEHSELEAYRNGNALMWGTIHTDGSGDIKAHVGGDLFATIREDYHDRLRTLHVDLIDLFVKHFTQKPLTTALVEIKEYLAENVDSLSQELRRHVSEGNWERFNELFRDLVAFDLFLSKEGVQLPESVRKVLYSAIWEQEQEQGDSEGEHADD